MFALQPDGSRLSPPFEGDIIEAALSLEATTHTTAVFANYGLTDRWDVGLALPFVKVSLDASVNARIIRLVTEPPADAPITAAERLGALNAHTFELNNPDATRTIRRSGEAAGLGDLILRTKYRLLAMAGGGLAPAVDVRLPTGDEEELLGTGGVQAKLLLVASGERGRLGQHVNVGYTVAQGDVAGTLAGLSAAAVPDEINYSGGVELVASPRLTIMGDVVGRTLRDAGRLGAVGKTFEYSDPSKLPPGVPPVARILVEAGILSFPTSSVSLDELDPRAGNLSLVLGAAGAKFNPTGNLLISASVLFPLTDAGLRSRVTTVVGVDYAF